MKGTISEKLVAYHQQTEHKDEVFTARGGCYASDCCDCGFSRWLDDTVCCCFNCCDDCNSSC
jgi:hypothetical protein